MDILKTSREIGLFETAVNLSKVADSADIKQKVGASMPLPGKDIESELEPIARWLVSFGKRKYMLLTPELALIEAINKHSDSFAEFIITLPCDLDTEVKERIRNNLPHDAVVTILEEPYFPEAFYPGNGMIVACGYSAGNKAMVLTDTYRMIEHYSGFLGKKVFIPYKELDTAARYDGWMEINRSRFSAKWQNGGDDLEQYYSY